jgi:hypothetical protein
MKKKASGYLKAEKYGMSCFKYCKHKENINELAIRRP